MLTLESAIERVTTTRDEYQSQRAYADALWVLQAAYDGGQQWGFLSAEAGRINIDRLPNIVDPGRSDVRLTMNYIHRDVKFLKSNLSPQRIASHCEARTGRVEDLIVRDVSDKLLERVIHDIDGLRILREMNLPRFVLGAMFVRRCMRQRRGPISLAAVGQEQMSLKTPDYYWSLVFPWEVIREVTATSFRPERDESIFIHEKPRSVDWVKQNLGVELKTQTKLGDLIDQQSRIHARGGIGYGATLARSKQPGVLVYEAYIRDPDLDTPWPWVLMAYSDPKGLGAAIKPIGPGLHRNPFYGLPFHGFGFDQQIQAPWPRGIPLLEMHAQNMLNLSMTWLMRIMQAGCGKWLYEKSTVEDPQKAFNNRLDQAIPWTRKAGPDPGMEPKWIAGPQINPAVIEMLRAAPRWMQDSLNLSEVQRGKTSPRGESGEAVREKLSAANIDIEDLRRDDELTISDLLYGTLADMTNPQSFRLDTAREIVGMDIPDDQIMTLLRNPVTRAITNVAVHPSTVRPTTPAEVQDQFTALATSMIIDPALAQWEMDERGISVNGLLAGARRLQLMEIQSMTVGQDALVAMTDHHAYHRETIRRFLNSPTAMTIDPLARQRILEHDANHVRAMIAEAQGLGAMQPPMPVQPGRPSPPASGPGAPGQAATAPVGAAAMVA